MASKPQPSRTAVYDIQLLFPVLFLVGIGIVMVYSASSALAFKKYGSDYFFLKKQATFALLGLVALVIGRHFPYRFYRYLAYPLLAMALAFLLAVQYSELGISAGGARRWLQLGRIAFQPSEFARFAVVIYLAYSMEKKSERLKEFSVGFVPHVLILSVFIFLISRQPDFGSAVILAALTWMMLFIGGVRIRYLGISLLTVLPLAYFFLTTAAYRVRRILGFWRPWQHPADEGYQIVHSLMAFGSGGIWGAGIGKGYQKLFYLPEPHTDFIFAVIGEELGLLGVIVIVSLYAWVLVRGISIAKNASDTFGSFLSAGLTLSLGLEVVVNMAVTLGLLPTKGLTLPFLSYGGTSLLLNMTSVGILMNISASRNRSKQGV